MAKHHSEKLGIIGGLGPAATVQLFGQIVAYTDADCDQEHLDITILNRPDTPDRTNYLKGLPDAPSFVEPMQHSAHELEEAGCSFICTPCNTAHSKLDEIAGALDTARFISMPRETALFAADLGCTACGIMATDGAVLAGVYQRELEAVGIECVLPTEASQAAVMSLIYDDVKAGRTPNMDAFGAVCDELVARGCDGIILGCTELSCLGAERLWRGKTCIIDALDVLAWRCVIECGAKARDLRAEYGSGN